MNLVEMLRIWRGRRILTALALLVALVGCALAVTHLPRTYQAKCTVILVPSPRASRALGEGNPYLSFTESLSTAADVMATELTAPATVRLLAARGFTESYTAVPESTTTQTVAASGSVLPGPFVLVTVNGGSPRAVEHTLYGVTAMIRSTVRAMQAGLSRNNRIVVSILSFSPQAALSVSLTARSMGLVIGLLIVLALAAPLLVDAQIARRRRRRDLAAGRIPAQQAAAERPVTEKPGARKPATAKPAGQQATAQQAAVQPAGVRPAGVRSAGGPAN
jgi:hypothetical protein